MLFWHWVRAAAPRTFWTAGRSRPMRMAMMAMTTSNSISVNAAWAFFRASLMTKPPRREEREGYASVFRRPKSVHDLTVIRSGREKELRVPNQSDGAAGDQQEKGELDRRDKPRVNFLLNPQS